MVDNAHALLSAQMFILFICGIALVFMGLGSSRYGNNRRRYRPLMVLSGIFLIVGSVFAVFLLRA